MGGGGKVVEEKEMTECYKCDTKIMGFVGQVHPLCGECQESFDDWFEQQLRIFR